MKIYPVITIDGPSGTGKGTISQLVAKELGWNLLDSGSLYRVLALAAAHHHVDIDNEKGLTALAGHLDVQFKVTEVGNHSRVILEGEDVTDAIRSEECGNNASVIAVMPKVRQALLARQRAFLREPGLIADGRDMGTVVFPDTIVKIYLEASHEARAERRCKQLKEKGIKVDLKRVYKDIDERDKRDKRRAVAPLKPAKDAIIVDTTHLSIEQVFDQVLQTVRSKLDAEDIS